MPPIVVAALVAGGAAVASTAVQSSAAKGAAKTAADAAKNAGDVESKAAEEALVFQKQVYADRKAQLDPYVRSGQAAETKMADLLGLQLPPAAPGGPAPAPAAPPVETAPGGLRAGLRKQLDAPKQTPADLDLFGRPGTAATPQTADAGTVTIQIPGTTDTTDVPAGLAEFYKAKGAKVIQSAVAG